MVVGYGNGPSGTEAWLARVGAAGSGVLTLDNNLNNSLAGTSQPLTGVTGYTNLVLNGAHHRPLMDSALPGGNNCAWVNGDLARYDNGRDAAAGLAEVGYCHRVRPDELIVGVGLGKSGSDEDTAFSGNSETDGQYLLAELDYRPDGRGPIYSLTGLYGAWGADIKRGYLNAGLQDSSTGSTDLKGAALRARIDWPGLWRLGDTAFTPRAQFSLTHVDMDGYAESGGGFPAIFNDREHTAKELRAGVRAGKPLSERTTIHGDLEAVHRFDGAGPATSGNIIGAFAFDIAGANVASNWLRAGLELDHALARNWTVSASLNAATNGEDPDVSGAVSLKMGW